MLRLYMTLMGMSAPLLRGILRRRTLRGKEDPARLGERMGIPGRRRPDGNLIWIHAASVGEAQSILSLVRALLEKTSASVLVTTGTVTSARMMEQRLPARALHQFYPLDHPRWTKAFLDYWRPSLVLWTESELWPSMLTNVRKHRLPAVLVNARLSDRSFRRWKHLAEPAREILSAFRLVLAQTEDDAVRFRALGAADAAIAGNLKYSAEPLPADDGEITRLRQALKGRPLWLYASTHDGEEELACRLHTVLKKKIPDILTVIVPRHPARGEEILHLCEKTGLRAKRRTEERVPPQPGDDIYIADTLGELGLFYRLSPLACIGRSFSRDGGGGHNPLEAAQLDCAVLCGPHVQNLQAIYDDMICAGAAVSVRTEQDFLAQLEFYLTHDDDLQSLRRRGVDYAREKARVLETVMTALQPYVQGVNA